MIIDAELEERWQRVHLVSACGTRESEQCEYSLGIGVPGKARGDYL